MSPQRLIDPEIDPSWYNESDEAEATRLAELDALQASWDADNAEYDEGNPRNKAEPSEDEEDDDIESSEQNADTDDGQTTADTAATDNEASNNPEIPYSDSPKKKSIMSKQRAAVAAGITAGIASIVIGIVMLLPQLIVNNLREWIFQKTGKIQSSQALKYSRPLRLKMSDVFNRDGRRGKKIITEMSKRGFIFKYDSKGNIAEIIDQSGNSVKGTAIAGTIEKHLDDAHPIKNIVSKNWKTKGMNAFYTRFGVSRASPVEVKDAADLQNVEKTINKNISRGVLQGEASENVINGAPVDENGNPVQESPEQIKARQAAQADAAQFAKDSGLTGPIKSAALDGENLDNSAIPLAKAIDGIESAPTKEALDAVKNTVESGSVLGFLKSLTLTGTVDKFCTARNRLNGASIAGRIVRSLSLIRYSSLFVGTADGVRTGKSNAKLVKEMMKRVMGRDKNNRPFGDSEGLKRALLNKFSRSRNDSTKSKVSTDGDLGGVFGVLQSKFNNIPGCSIAQNPFAQILEPVAQVAIAAFTGGAGEAGVQAGIQASKEAVVLYFRNFLQNVMTKQFAVKFLASTIASIGISEIMSLVQLYAEKTMYFNFTGQERGGSLADINFAGGGAANKMRWLQAGYVPATPEQYSQIETAYLNENAQDFKKLGFFQRIFDSGNEKSLAYQLSARTVINTPGGTEGLAILPSNLFRMATTTLRAEPLANLASNLVGGKAYAAAENSDSVSFLDYKISNRDIHLATDQAGNNLVVMRDDIRSILEDPIANQDFLLSNQNGGPYIDSVGFKPIGDFAEHVKNCVTNPNIISALEAHEPSDPSPKTDCLANSPLTQRFKAHLAWLDAQDSFDAEIIPEDIDTGAGPSLGGNSTIVDCSAARGNGKIVCAAQSYSGIPYAHARPGYENALRGGGNAEAWLAKNNNDLNFIRTNAFVECSGFANLSLWIAYQYKTKNGCSKDYAMGTDPNVTPVLSPAAVRGGQKLSTSMLQAGDFLTISESCNTSGSPGHVGIFVKDNGNGTFTTLESSGATNSAGKKESGFYIHPLSKLGGTGAHDYKYAGRYIGPGSGPP